jgi:hypothetical protein
LRASCGDEIGKNDRFLGGEGKMAIILAFESAITLIVYLLKGLRYTEHGHKLRILKIRDNIVKIEKVVKRLRND